MSQGSGRDDGYVPLFVERRTYRRRRITDAIRALPVLGVLLWLLPLLWSHPDNQISTSHALIYIFTVWVVLAVGAGGLIVALWRGRREERKAGDPG